MIFSNRHLFITGWLLLAVLVTAGCEGLPGQKEPFAVGPLRFGLTLAEAKKLFPDKDWQLDTYDTELGQTWSVVEPFAVPPAPEWLTISANRLALSFWDDRLFRVRLHYDQATPVELQEFKKRFERGYELQIDQSQGERIFIEYNAPQMKIFLAGGGAEKGSVSFVDLPAYRGLEPARRRWQKKASDGFTIGGMKFGMSMAQVEQATGQTLAPSDFFDGMENRRWDDSNTRCEYELGFDAQMGLAAIALIFQERRPPAKVQERLLEMTRQYGQGEVRPSTKGYTIVIDAADIRVSLMVIDCGDEGCVLSEGYLWAGPPL